MTTPIVRVTQADPLEIEQEIDVGAMGVIVPMVRTGSDVETIVGTTRYPPTGTRNFGPLRASRYGQDYDDFLNRVNDNVLVAIIVETKEAIETLDQIAGRTAESAGAGLSISQLRH